MVPDFSQHLLAVVDEFQERFSLLNEFVRDLLEIVLHALRHNLYGTTGFLR